MGSCNRFLTSYRAFQCRRATSLSAGGTTTMLVGLKLKSPGYELRTFECPNVQTF